MTKYHPQKSFGKIARSVVKGLPHLKRLYLYIEPGTRKQAGVTAGVSVTLRMADLHIAPGLPVQHFNLSISSSRC